MIPVLYIVIPCFNEQEVLPVTSGLFLNKLREMSGKGKISEESKIVFVNDGSRDETWNIISELASSETEFEGISLSRNRGHQNALLAGLMTVKDRCDITISIDCDGQDDIGAIEAMVDEYLAGSEIVYGVRSKRETDTFFKRATAEGFYKLVNGLGGEVVFNHADYRLMSRKALDALADFKEVNLFLRGLVPLVGFKTSTVEDERTERMAGKSHYPLKKMFALAFDGITSLSVKPIHLITALGLLFAFFSFIGIIWAVVQMLRGATVSGWASIICIVCFIGGIQLIALGVIGEYVGKIYLETKQRPRYIIEKTTF